MGFDSIAFDEFAERVLLLASFSALAWLAAFAARSIEEKRPRRPGPLAGPWLPWYGSMALGAGLLHRALAGGLPDALLLPLLLALPIAADCLWKGLACPRLGIEWRDRSGDFLNLKGIMSLRAGLCWVGYVLACLYAAEPMLQDALAAVPSRIKAFAAGAFLACVAVDGGAFLFRALAARRSPE